MRKIWELTGSLIGVILLLTSCSDKATEMALQGAWECRETEREDGVEMVVTETLTLCADTHQFEQRVEMKIFLFGECMHLASFKIKGEWSATKKNLTLDFNKKDIHYSINRELLAEMGGHRQLIEEIMESAGTYNLHFTGGDTFALIDDDGERTEYTRIDQPKATAQGSKENSQTEKHPTESEERTGVFSGNFNGAVRDVLIAKPHGEYDADIEKHLEWRIQTEKGTVEDLILRGTTSVDFIKIGDIDGNGTDEWGYVAIPVCSYWTAFHLYTYSHGRWVEMIDPVTVWEGDEIVESAKDIVWPAEEKGWLYVNEWKENPETGEVTKIPKKVQIKEDGQ